MNDHQDNNRNHLEFLTMIDNRLSQVKPSKEIRSRFDDKQKQRIKITIECFDKSSFQVELEEDCRIFQLKKSIETTFNDRTIRWKSVWKRYSLINDRGWIVQGSNRSIGSSTTLRFIRRHRC